MSVRAYHRIIRVARTIADLEGGDRVRKEVDKEGKRKTAKAVKRDPEPSSRIKIDQETIERENRADVCHKIIDLQKR